MSIPNFDRAMNDEVPEVSPSQQAPAQANSQLVGCYLCLMEGNVDQPEVIYHYAGTSYCIDHLFTVAGGNQ